MQRQQYFQYIKDQLQLLAFKINGDTLLNLTDTSVYSENLFANLLNEVFECNLINNNILSSNADTIDLVDDKNKICVQVTSNKSTEKIRKTLDSFKDNNYETRYSTLYILVIATKKYNSRFDKTNYFDQRTNLLTITELLRRISGIVDINKLKRIYDIIKGELEINKPDGYMLLNEVQTISKIIQYISGKEDYNPQESIEPDPDNKINNRFKEYAADISREFITYTKLYKTLFDEIYGQLSQSQVSKVSVYLMRESVKELEAVKNPMQAITNMVEKFKKEFSSINLNIDENALYYFLYKQVIICNVFPNEE